MSESAQKLKPAVLWMKQNWHLKHNPYPGEGIARLGKLIKRKL